jgi:hypothetical protein
LTTGGIVSPKVVFTIVWQEPKPYALDELKQAYSRAIDLDDDGLTQFVEAAELREKISKARSFDELVAV